MKLLSAQGGIAGTDIPADAMILAELRLGSWLIPATGDVPAACIDGRPPSTVRAEAAFPRSAGGTIGLWVARNLSAAELSPLFELTTRLAAAGIAVGDHTGDQSGADADCAGCGAADHLGDLLGLIDSPAVRELVEAWGFDAHQIDTTMAAQASSLQESEYTGAELVTSIAAVPNSYVPLLHGPHRESFAVINQVEGTTLDGAALAAQSMQAFTVDAWTFMPAARTLAPECPERFAAALAAVNAAALLVLVQPGFRAVTVHG